MKAAILCTGSEIVRGRTVDTNSNLIVRGLLSAGILTEEIRSVNDEIGAIALALRELTDRYAVVICSGGLGPTFDDLTRLALAQATARKLTEHPDALEVIRGGLVRRNRPDLFEANRCQALLPEGAEAIPNHVGSAPGIHLETGASSIFCLPGVPGELVGMLDGYVLPALAGRGACDIITAGWNFCGMPEAELGRIVEEVMAGRDAESAINASKGIIAVSVLVRGPAASAVVAEIGDALASRTGNVFVGPSSESLEHVVGELFRRKDLSLGCVESCTAGLISKRLTDVPASSDYFRGGIVAYSNELKARIGVSVAVLARYGAVSGETAVEMAMRGREWLGVDVCLSATGIAGPGGGTPEKPVGTAYVAVSGPAGCKSRKLLYSGDRDSIRQYSATAAINLARLAALEM